MKMDLKMAKDFSDGKTEPLTRGIGEIIKCMGKEYSSGKMDDNTKENITTTSSMESALSYGQMDAYMKVAGKEVKCMGLEN